MILLHDSHSPIPLQICRFMSGIAAMGYVPSKKWLHGAMDLLQDRGALERLAEDDPEVSGELLMVPQTAVCPLFFKPMPSEAPLLLSIHPLVAHMSLLCAM